MPVKARILQITEFLPDSGAFGRLTSRPFSPDYAAQANDALGIFAHDGQEPKDYDGNDPH